MQKVSVISKSPLGENRQIEIQQLFFDDETTLTDLFMQIKGEDHYYTLSQYYPGYTFYCLMLRNICPYIRINGELYWNIPYNQVKVKDFLVTQDFSRDNEIIVEIDAVGGFGDAIIDYVVQSWIILWEIISNGMTLIDFLKMIHSAFGKKKEKVPTVPELIAYVSKNDCWAIDDLANELCTTRAFAKKILDYSGFEHHDGLYWKNAWKGEMLEREIANIEYAKYIKNYQESELEITRDWDPVMNKEINSYLLCIYELCVGVGEIDLYDNTMEEVNMIIDSNELDSYEQYERCKQLLHERIQELEKRIGFQ